MKTVLKVALQVALGLVAAAALNGVQAQPQTEWTKQVEIGDTLIGISKRFLREPLQWRDLQKHNALRNADLIAPGSSIRIPVQWMRGEPTTAAVVHVQGEATVQPAGGSAATPARTGDALSMGSRLRTGADSAMTLRFMDGSQVVVTPQTEVTLEQMLTFPATGGFGTTRLNLQRGAVESQVVPAREAQRSYEITTPVVTLGVRGTQFRAAAAPAGNSRLEVVQGQVQADASRSAAVEAGQGVVTAADGRLGDVETLLPPPTLGAGPQLDAGGTATMQWPALPGATAYRVQLFAATEADALLRDSQTPSTAVAWPGLPPGAYRVRVRGIAASGLEGQNADNSVQLAAYVPPPPPGPPPPVYALPEAGQRLVAEAAALSWYGPRAGLRYRVQVARDASFAAPLHDETSATPSLYVLVQTHVKLPAGRYHWRVATLGPQGEPGPFGPPRSFELAAPVP